MYRTSQCARGLDDVLIKDDTQFYEMDEPYYPEREMMNHYPNMYDFRKAAVFRQPGPVFAPYITYNRPAHLQSEDFRKRRDELTLWQEAKRKLHM